MQDVIRGPYFADILAQPKSLASLRSRLEQFTFSDSFQQKLDSKRLHRIVLTGMGSSLHALYPTIRRLSRLNFCAHRLEAAELLCGFESFRDPSTLLVAVSQSGESAEIVQLMGHADQFGHVIGVTNNPESTLGQIAQTTIDLAAGPEATVSCKTYLCTLAAMHWLETRLSGGCVKQAINDIKIAEVAAAAYLSRWGEHVSQWLPLVEGVQSIFVTGRGDSLATAMTGGLVLKESTRQHAEGMSCAAFRHGPMEMASENVLVVIFEGQGPEAALNRRLADDIRRGGGKAVLIRSELVADGVCGLPEVPDAVRPIVEILPIKMLSLAIAAREGIEAGRFERASKITSIA